MKSVRICLIFDQNLSQFLKNVEQSEFKVMSSNYIKLLTKKIFCFACRHDKKRSQSFEEELEPQTNRRQLPNVPKKPGRQTRDNFNREPTPDYDSEKDLKNDNKTPLATSPVKNSPEKNPEPEEINKNTENLNNQARGKFCFENWVKFNGEIFASHASIFWLKNWS